MVEVSGWHGPFGESGPHSSPSPWSSPSFGGLGGDSGVSGLPLSLSL